MARGLNTEINPRALGDGQYPEFTMLTHATGAITPRRADAATTGASDRTKYLIEFGTQDYAEVYNEADKTTAIVYHDKAGTGDLYITTDNGTTVDYLLYDAPNKPVYISVSPSLVPVTAPSVIKYAAAVSDPDIIQGETALSSLVEWYKADLKQFTATTATGGGASWILEPNTTMTNSTKTATAKSRTNVAIPVSPGTFTVIFDTKSDTQTWAAGDSITFATDLGTVTATISITEAAVTAPAVGYEYLPVYSFDGALPINWNKWKLYRLDTTSSRWREVGESASTITDVGSFPYVYVSSTDYTTILSSEWPGPVDEQGDPVEQITRSTLDSTTEFLRMCVHKGCLFVGINGVIYYSDPEQPRYFRKASNLQALGTIRKMVGREELVELYCDNAVKYIVGNPPYFEVRETGINEGPIGVGVVRATDVGTFALFDDGIYLCNGMTRKNITAGNNTTWLRDYASTLTNGTMFASKGILYLVETGGNALCYDWEHDEFYGRTFTTGKIAVYDAGLNALVYKTGTSTYATVETSDSAVDWAVKWKQLGDGRLRPTPVRAFVDADTVTGINLTFYCGDDPKASYPIDEPKQYNLPATRARFYSFRASGSEKSTDMVLRMIEAKP